MGEPGQDPRDDENDQIDLPETLKNLIELWIFLYEHGQDHLADQNAKSANVVGQKISKICFSCFLHEIVSLIVAKKHNEHRCHVVETLDIL